MRAFFWLLAMLCITGCSTSRKRTGKDKFTAQDRLQLGKKYLKRGNYTKALEQFNHIRNYYRDDPAAIEAELSIANMYYKKGEWDQAKIYYDEFRRRHPTHQQLDFIDFRTGMSHYKKASKVPDRDQRDTKKAMREWQNFEKKYPKSKHKKQAIKRREECRNRLARKELIIAEFYQRRQAWESVHRRSVYLIQYYPDSKYHAEALGINAVANTMLGKLKISRQAMKLLQKKDIKIHKKYQEKLTQISKNPPKVTTSTP